MAECEDMCDLEDVGFILKAKINSVGDRRRHKRNKSVDDTLDFLRGGCVCEIRQRLKADRGRPWNVSGWRVWELTWGL